jgi:membrane protein
MSLQDVWQLGKDAAGKWNEHNAPRLSAALAYYTLLSLAPVVVLLILICGLVFARGSAEQHLIEQVRHLVGNEWVDTLREVIENTQPSTSGLIASFIAVGVLLFGASAVFAELRDSLNTIWDAPTAKACLTDFVRRRIASFAMVLTFGLLILASTLVDVTLKLIEKRFTGYLPQGATSMGEFANTVVSFVAITVLFALIFKFVPDVAIGWKDVGIGAAVTAVLFAVGHTLLALYLTRAAVGSAYGAAGSLVAFVAWIYYCAQIFFFGAILTRVYALNRGSHSQQSKSKPLNSARAARAGEVPGG